MYTLHGAVVACIHGYLTHRVVQLVAEQLLLGHLAVWKFCAINAPLITDYLTSRCITIPGALDDPGVEVCVFAPSERVRRISYIHFYIIIIYYS